MKRGMQEMNHSLFSGDEKQYVSDNEGVQITRKQTTIEREVRSRLDSASHLTTGLISHEDLAKHGVEQYMPHVS